MVLQRRPGSRLGRGGRRVLGVVVIFIVLAVFLLLALEVLGSLVLVNGAGLVIAIQYIANVAGAELVQFLVLVDDDDCDLDVAQDAQLVGFLEESTFAFQKGDRAIAVILDGLNCYFSSPHDQNSRRSYEVTGLYLVSGGRVVSVPIYLKSRGRVSNGTIEKRKAWWEALVLPSAGARAASRR